jgi:hypothetical protein
MFGALATSIAAMRSSLLVAVAVATLASLSRPAFADAWAQSFDAPDLDAIVAGNARLAVLAVGDADTAATALRAALEQLDKIELVLDGQSLGGSGALATLDDRTILARAAGLPVDGVIIVRLYHGRHGRPDHALVTLYHPGGVSVRALSVEEGALLSLPRQTFEPKPGPALERYNNEKLGASEGFHMAFFATRHDLEFYRGDYHIPLRGDEFFTRVGRPDLAARWSTRQGVRKALMAFGVIFMAGGIAALVSGPIITSRPSCTMYSTVDPGLCIAHGESDSNALIAGVVGGLAGLGAGTGLLIGGAVMRAAPVSTGEAEQLSDAHNRRLRHTLGLEEVRLAPSLSPTFAGASLRMTF